MEVDGGLDIIIDCRTCNGTGVIWRTDVQVIHSTSEDKNLWYGTSGPPDANIVLVGEAWGAEEAAEQRPFVGSSGTELNRMLAEARLDRSKILCTNVVAERPPNNEMWRLFHPKETPSGRPLIRGLDPRDNVVSEVSRLYSQITAFPRRAVIAAGNYSLWALSNCTGAAVQRESNRRLIPRELQALAPNGIMSWRGSMWYFEPHNGPKTATPLVPLIHPAAIMRQWSLRTVTVHDLKLRVKNLALAGDWRPDPPPVFWAPPTFEQCAAKLEEWLRRADSGEKLRLAEDIETARGLITCLGLADSPHFAMSIPFIRRCGEAGKEFESWWTIEQEARLVSLLRRLNSHPNILVEGQNFIYDTQYIQHWMAVTPRTEFDSMLCQNVLFPGTPKPLEYLSSLYCRYHWYWKEDHKEWDMKGAIEDLLLYNCMDCVRTFEVCTVQRQMVASLGMEEQMSFKMKVHDLCLRMMNRGILVDKQRRAELSLELMTAMQELENDLITIIPQEMVSPNNPTPWYRSDTQTRYLYYDRLGFDIQRDRKTKQPSVGREARQSLKKLYPEFGGLFERLRLYGSAENTHNVINAGLDSDDRLRCSYNPGGTETHRLSSSKTAFGRGTNLQNLSKGEEDD